MQRRLLLLIVFMAAASGCKSRSAPPPIPPDPSPITAAPPTTTTAETTTTTSATSFEVPAVIDLPYVQRVLEAIYHLDGEATRHVYANKIPDAELYERLEAIFGDPALSDAKRVLMENAAEGFVRFADPPGYPTIRVSDLIQASTTCIIVQGFLDFRPIYTNPGLPSPKVVIRMARADVIPFNPTGWGVLTAGVPADPNKDLKIC